LLLVETSPLYAVTLAVLAGDAAGNFHLFVPLPVAVLLSGISAGMFLAKRNAMAMVAPLSAIVFATTSPVHRLLEPRKQ